MSKKILIIALALAGYIGTTQFIILGAYIAFQKASSKNSIMVPEQTKRFKPGKNKVLVSGNSNIASVKKVDHKKWEVTAHKAGKAFIEIVNKNSKKSETKKRKGYTIIVAAKALPSHITMEEGEKKYFKITPGNEFHQDNKHEHEAGSIRTKNITLTGSDKRKYKVLKIKAIDYGKEDAILKDKEGKTVSIKVKETENKKDEK